MVPIPTTLKGADLVRIRDWSRSDLETVLEHATRLKAYQRRGVEHALLERRTLGMIFDKPSTRTRVSFEVAMTQLGGSALELRRESIHLGHGEPVRDTAIVLSRFLDALVVRTHEHALLEELAASAEVPVINGLTAEHHPCQALADVLTIRERFGDAPGIRVAYFGDAANNVARSLIEACSILGISLTVAAPPAYEPDEDTWSAALAAAEASGAELALAPDPREAAAGAHVLYTDVWTSMGLEDEAAQRHADLAVFGLDEALLELASDDAAVMHCLPAKVGEEITEALLYGDRSAVWDQAENRLHAQKALLALVVE